MKKVHSSVALMMRGVGRALAATATDWGSGGSGAEPHLHNVDTILRRMAERKAQDAR